VAKRSDEDTYFIAITDAPQIRPGMVVVTVGGDYSYAGEWLVESVADGDDESKLAVTLQHRKSGKRTVSQIPRSEIVARKIVRSWIEPVQDSEAVVD